MVDDSGENIMAIYIPDMLDLFSDLNRWEKFNVEDGIWLMRLFKYFLSSIGRKSQGPLFVQGASLLSCYPRTEQCSYQE